jgi:hydroxyacylglutathione hydrolase
MRIEVFSLGPLGTNCYLVTSDDEKQGIVIDPGMNPEPLLKRIKYIDILAILLTHAHFDHIGGVEAVRKIKKSQVYIHPIEQDWLTDAKKNGSYAWRDLGGEVSTSKAECELKHGDELTFFGNTFKVLHTPGHSPGSVSFSTPGHCFSGDALFANSIGRTDLPGGDHNTLIRAIQAHLFSLPDDTTIYPGHGSKTTIDKEKRDNPFLGSRRLKPKSR